MQEAINLKVVLLGSGGVGKTSLMHRFVLDKFYDNGGTGYTSTIGSAYVAKEMKMGGKKIILGIWDTAGEEKFQSVCTMFYRNANAAIVCFDVTNEKSWAGARKWVSELRHKEENCVIYLCATKMDILEESRNRKVAKEKIALYISGVTEIKKYFETSSKTGHKVSDVFHAICSDYLEGNGGRNKKPCDTKGITDLYCENNVKHTCCF